MSCHVTHRYLRKALFPMHSDLRYVGMFVCVCPSLLLLLLLLLLSGILNPLDCPHHMRQDVHAPYREGVVLEKPGARGKALVNCGLKEVCYLTSYYFLLDLREGLVPSAHEPADVSYLNAYIDQPIYCLSFL